MNPVKELIEFYKDNLQKNGLGDELFKWQILRDFRGRPDVSAPDFFEEIKSIDFRNLIYPVGIGVVNHLAKDRPEEYRECFKILFDEAVPLQERILRFSQKTLSIYRELIPDPKLSHHQDERTMATFLAYHNPEKYPLYKDSFYRKYCQLLGIKPKKKGEKYVHYLELIKDFKRDYIERDEELLRIVYSEIPKDYFLDINHLVLAQDILYVGLEKLSQGQEISGLMASDGTGWQDNYISEFENFDSGIVWNSKTPSGTTKTLKFLERIIEEGNTFNLYYSSKNHVTHRAEVIDFAINDKEYKEKNWNKSRKIFGFQPNFNDYFNGKLIAKIVFLIGNFEKIKPIPVQDFKFFEKYMAPTQDNLSPITSEPENYDVIDLEKTKDTENFGKYSGSVNQILFGPPGTGKTYNSINKAMEIIGVDISKYTRDDLKKVFDEKVKEGQIVFTTFHQSLSYEDFIEGIKPIEPEKEGDNIIYKVVPGIFKQLCNDAKTPNQLGFDEAYEKLVETLTEKDQLTLQTPKGSEFSISLNSKGNLTLHTGKQREKQGTLTQENIKKQINGEVKFFGWEGYFQGVIEYLKKNFGYSIQIENSQKNYVLIIDEINRGNVSQIFGELITLIEDDKRLGEKNEIQLKLPYSREQFGVPSNVYIIGTMNTADRSVEALDTALRRRFSFEEFKPNPKLIEVALLRWYVNRFIKDWNLPLEDKDWCDFENQFSSLLVNTNSYHDLEKKEIQKSFPNKDSNECLKTFSKLFEEKMHKFLLVEFIRIINSRIEFLLDIDHQIGHSYLLNVYSIPDFKIVFYNKILPLLQEYFFGDIGKLGLILGDGFVRKKEKRLQNKLFANFVGAYEYDFSEKIIYEVVDFRDPNIDHVIEINGEKKKLNFEEAIRLILADSQ